MLPGVPTIKRYRRFQQVILPCSSEKLVFVMSLCYNKARGFAVTCSGSYVESGTVPLFYIE